MKYMWNLYTWCVQKQKWSDGGDRKGSETSQHVLFWLVLTWTFYILKNVINVKRKTQTLKLNKWKQRAPIKLYKLPYREKSYFKWLLNTIWKLSNFIEIRLKEKRNGACFGSTYTKIETIQRRLAWPLCKDDTQIREAFHIFKKEKKKNWKNVNLTH